MRRKQRARRVAGCSHMPPPSKPPPSSPPPTTRLYRLHRLAHCCVGAFPTWAIEIDHVHGRASGRRSR